MGNQKGWDFSVEKSIRDDLSLGIDMNMKKINLLPKELLTFWVKKKNNSHLIIKNVYYESFFKKQIYFTAISEAKRLLD